MRSASRDPVVGDEALEVLNGVTRLLVAKGKSIVELDLEAETFTDEELLELLLGRSGNLRAPAIRVGSRLLIGYNQELLETVLGATP